MIKTMTALEHQKMRESKWHEDCAKWSGNEGLQSFPQLSMYGFHKNYGYVTFDTNGRTSCWRKTKQESIESFIKLNKGE